MCQKLFRFCLHALTNISFSLYYNFSHTTTKETGSVRALAKIEIADYQKTAQKSVPVKHNLSYYLTQNKSQIILSLFGLIISRTKLFFNMTPLGCAFYAAAYEGQALLSVPLLIAVLVGNISGVLAFPIKYILANALFLLAATFQKKWAFQNVYTTGFCMAMSLFICGLYYVAMEGFLLYDVFELLLEAFIVFVAVIVFKKGIPIVKEFAPRSVLEKEEVLSLFAIAVACVGGLGGITLPFAFSLQRLVSIYLILFAAQTAGVGVSSVLAVSFGFIIGLSGNDPAGQVAAFAVCAVASGLFAKYGKWASALAFLLTNATMAIYLSQSAVPFIPFSEVIAASILFLTTPRCMINAVNNFIHNSETEKNYSEKIKEMVHGRLSKVSNAFLSLSSSFDKLALMNKPVNYADVSSMFDMTADRVCKSCGLKFNCWEKNFNNTYDVMFKILEKLDEKGKIDASDVPVHFAVSCGKLNEFIGMLNHLYEVHKVDFKWKTRMTESRELVSKQLNEVAKIMDNLAGTLDEEIAFDAELERELKSALESERIKADGVTVLKKENQKVEVELTVHDCSSFGFCKINIEPIVSNVLARPMVTKERSCEEGACKVQFVEAPKYTIESGAYTLPKDGEKRPGDSFAFVDEEYDSYTMALSDGMGSGEKAATLSFSTVSLLKNFLGSGFSIKTALNMINSVLVLRPGEECFATVDISTVDLKSGMAKFVKIGAASTFIKRKERVDRIASTSLPAGILEDVDMEVFSAALRAGDYIIMMSDGILDPNETEFWVQDALSFIEDFSPNEIAKYLVETAKERKKGKVPDDMTALVLRMKESA